MPIKFRCRHCKQLLGISHRKAGELVDCPTCGRTVRVPLSDGPAEPAPPPKMDLQDAALVEALDQLASLADRERPVAGSTVAKAAAVPHAAVAAPVIVPPPAPQPIVRDAPLPAVPVSIANHAAHRKPSGEASLPLEPWRELASVAAAAPAVAPASSPSLTGWQAWVPYPIFLLCCGVAIAAFGTGFLTGWIRRGVRLAETSPMQAPDSPSSVDSSATASADPKPIPKADPFDAGHLRGRITFKTSDAESRPDAGAVVIVFPPQRSGEAKLSIVGFRPTDVAADFQIAAAGLRALGGNVAIVDDAGNFDVPLSGAGTYRILVLSRFQQRDGDDPGDPELSRLLEAYFDRPLQLLGRLRYHFGQARHGGSDAVTWDHSFDKS